MCDLKVKVSPFRDMKGKLGCIRSARWVTLRSGVGWGAKGSVTVGQNSDPTPTTHRRLMCRKVLILSLACHVSPPPGQWP